MHANSKCVEAKHFLPEVSPESFRDVELQPPLHQMAKDGLELSEHFLVSVLAIRLIGRGQGCILHRLQLRR